MRDDEWIGRRASYHRRGGPAQLGKVTDIADETHYGRTVYVITNDDPKIGTEHVPSDRIIGHALDGTPEGRPLRPARPYTADEEVMR